MEKGNENATTAAPTGCYKCGRPGHWSRDCPSSAPNSNSASTTFNSSRPFVSGGGGGRGGGGAAASGALKPAEKPKKAPKTRPKLTPELLLSDDGLGYVLRYFPRAVKYRGRGHEVEKVAATKRVKMCLGELRERVARGGDPTKLRESPILDDYVSNENEAKDFEGMCDNQEEASLRNNGADGMEEDMLQKIYEKATEEPSLPLQSDSFSAAETMEGLANQKPNASDSNEIQITEEQRARMEANRLKALERAKAKATRSLQAV